MDDFADAIAERVKSSGLYAGSSGNDGVYVATVRAIVQAASVSPAMGKRKVFIVGDAEQMVPQEGSEQAANALLKLLEEPPANTFIILTSSEPGALLPTIRSRVVNIRVAPLPTRDVEVVPRRPDRRPRRCASHTRRWSTADYVRLAKARRVRLFERSERDAADRERSDCSRPRSAGIDRRPSAPQWHREARKRAGVLRHARRVDGAARRASAHRGRARRRAKRARREPSDRESSSTRRR